MSETRHPKMVRLTLTIPSQNRGIGTRPSLISSFALLAFLMLACPAWAAITFDSNAEGTAASGTTYSFNHTLGTGSNKAIVVGVIVKDVSSTGVISSVTYNSSSMTAAYAEVIDTHRDHMRQFYLATSLAAGTYSVAVTLTSNAQGSKAVASSYFGVDQTTPLDAAGAGATGTTASPSVSITTVNNNAMIVDCLNQNGTNSETATSPQADVLTDVTSIPSLGKSDKTLATAGATTMSWTLGAAPTGWAINCLSLKPAGGGAPTCTNFIALQGVGCK